jgi:GntR family transcriptional repressor for pyruvate dehydrogenase complex
MYDKSESSITIEPFSPETRVQQIIKKFRELLINGQFSPGSKLPSEVELTRILGTSRTPIREAMKVLQALGGLEIKRGDGTYVSTSITPNTIQSLIFNLILQRGTPTELIELRLFFEEAYIKLAAIKRTEEDLRAIYERLRKMESLTLDELHNPDSLHKEDLEFHFTILNATHNRLVYEIGRVIMELFSTTIKLAHQKREVSESAFQNHRKIYDCIEKQDLNSIESVVKESLNYWETIVVKSI